MRWLLIVKLAHDIAAVINRDPAVRGLLKVAFWRITMSLAEIIIPTASLGAISTAGWRPREPVMKLASTAP
jgi:starch phosphorylase